MACFWLELGAVSSPLWSELACHSLRPRSVPLRAPPFGSNPVVFPPPNLEGVSSIGSEFTLAAVVSMVTNLLHRLPELDINGYKM